MQHIKVYSTHHCPWCVRAKALLDARGLDYEEINISADTDRTREMVERSGRRTVPQIFIDDQPIGGFVELSALDQKGKLN